MDPFVDNREKKNISRLKSELQFVFVHGTEQSHKLGGKNVKTASGTTTADRKLSPFRVISTCACRFITNISLTVKWL